MSDVKTPKRKTTKTFILFALLLILAVVCFFQFSPAGYRMSIPYRSSFAEIDDHIYVNRDCLSSKDELLEIVRAAKDRNADFWGEVSGNPVIIFCDDKKLLSRLGGDHDTLTIVFPTKQSYLSVSDEYCNVDILAHEITHAEFHHRLTAGALLKIPSWFDEGLAAQNDYREQYDLSTWDEKTDNGKHTIALEDMDEPSEFYAGTVEERRFRYINAKHEIHEWLKTRGRQGLLNFIDRLNDGADFYAAYGE